MSGAGPVRWFLTRGDRAVLYCLGDSHARVFERVREAHLLQRTTLDVTWVLGATALGMANPNSRSNALVDFRAALRGVPMQAPLVLLLGEIDCGYVLWYRAAHKGTNVREEFEQSLTNYTGFIEQLQDAGHTDVIVMTVPPPTIRDYATWGGLDNARRHVTASIEDRTRITAEYNERLREWAGRHGARVLDPEPDLMDPATGLVRDEFVNEDPLNHHLHPQRFAEVVAGRLRDLGFR